MMVQSGTLTASTGQPLAAPAIATTVSSGAAHAAAQNCAASGETCLALARLSMKKAAMAKAATSGIIAAQPSSATLGLSTAITPALASSIASQLHLPIRSPRNTADNSAMIAGLAKLIAVASASGMMWIDRKNSSDAVASDSPRAACTAMRGTAKPVRPSRQAMIVPNPSAPIEKRSAATAVPGHSPPIVLITASPHDRMENPHSASRSPLRCDWWAVMISSRKGGCTARAGRDSSPQCGGIKSLSKLSP